MISLNSLENMKIFAADSKQRDILLQDSTLIDGLVLLLSDKEHSVIKLTLEIFLLLAESPLSKDVLKRNNYLLLQMEETMRSDNIEIVKLGEKLLNLLRKNPTFPQSEIIYQTPKNQRSTYRQYSEQSSNGHPQKYKTLVFQLKGLLDKHDRELCTRLLIKIKGVVSIIFDMNRSCCTVRTLHMVSPETLAEGIAKSQTMLARQVVKNELGEEIIVPFGNEDLDVSYDGPDYLDEMDSPQADNQAVCLNDGLSKTSSFLGNWFQSAASFWNNGFW